MRPTTVIATCTLYQSLEEVRAKLALNTIKSAVEHGFPIIVVDSSVEPTIRESFREQGAIVFEGRGGMGVDRRQAIREATKLVGNNGVIVWMEPEKSPLVPLLPQIIPHIESTDLIIPQRLSLESYPVAQQHAEWLGNRAFQLLTGRALDVWFGPRVFRAPLAPFFLDYQGEYGDRWDSIFVPLLRAIKAGKKVIGVEVDYVHPEEQRQEEEEEETWFFMKRIDQLTSIIDALRSECLALGLQSS